MSEVDDQTTGALIEASSFIESAKVRIELLKTERSQTAQQISLLISRKSVLDGQIGEAEFWLNQVLQARPSGQAEGQPTGAPNATDAS